MSSTSNEWTVWDRNWKSLNTTLSDLKIEEGNLVIFFSWGENDELKDVRVNIRRSKKIKRETTIEYPGVGKNKWNICILCKNNRELVVSVFILSKLSDNNWSEFKNKVRKGNGAEELFKLTREENEKYTFNLSHNYT